MCRPPFERGAMWSSSRLRCRAPRPSQSRHKIPAAASQSAPLRASLRHGHRRGCWSSMSPAAGVPVIRSEDGSQPHSRSATHLHAGRRRASVAGRASSMRALHFSGLARRSRAISPKLAPAFFGATTGLNMASRALIALSYANSPSGETPTQQPTPHAGMSAAASSTAVARSKSSRSAALTRCAKPGSIQVHRPSRTSTLQQVVKAREPKLAWSRILPMGPSGSLSWPWYANTCSLTNQSIMSMRTSGCEPTIPNQARLRSRHRYPARRTFAYRVH